MLRLPLAFRKVFPRKFWIKIAFLAPGHHAHMIFYDINDEKNLIFIFFNKQEPGFGSLILLLEKSIFSKKSPNWCPGGIITTYNIISRFMCAENVKNQKNIFLNLDAWVGHCAVGNYKSGRRWLLLRSDRATQRVPSCLPSFLLLIAVTAGRYHHSLFRAQLDLDR